MAITFIDKSEAREYANQKTSEGYKVKISPNNGKTVVSLVGKETPKSVQPAFGSVGGKAFSASKIVKRIPPHKVYVEPFTGGAAIYFKKGISDKEVLNDKDKNIVFAFRFIKNMTPEQFERLKKHDWQASRKTFDKVKALQPRDDIERFYKFYYLKKASFSGSGTSFSPLKAEDPPIRIDRLPKVQERLKDTAIYNDDAVSVIKKYDSPDTFFYVDPPYPGRPATRILSPSAKEYDEEDLARLVNTLKNIKGKFQLSLGTEHERLLPSNWHVSRIRVKSMLPSKDKKSGGSYRYEILATNYQ